jgi:hypothetical protein
MGGAAVNKVFLETAGPLYAELTLLLEFAMAVGLVIGALLARLGRFRQHAWCQSVIVLLNLAVILLAMIPSFRIHVCPKIPLKLGKAFYGLATDSRLPRKTGRKLKELQVCPSKAVSL